MTHQDPAPRIRLRRSRLSWGNRAARLTVWGLFVAPALAPARATDPPITFCRDVAPILQANCQTCHHPGGIAPFSLLTYQNAKPYASIIKYVTQHRVMPPWKAVAGYGEFQDERRLTDDQIKTLAAWVDAGAPEGDPAELPPPRQFSSGWQLGTPDLVLDAGQAFDVPAAGGDIYRMFVLPFRPAQNLWITGIELLPGSPTVVHHVMVYLDPLAQSPAYAKPGPEPGFDGAFSVPPFSPALLLNAWGPGSTPHFTPPGTAWEVPAGAYLNLNVHYHPDGQPHRDRTRIGLYFARGPIDKRMRFGVLGNYHFSIPAGDPHYSVTFNRPSLPGDVTAYWVWPHMHMLGTEMQATATLPGGIIQPMLWVKNWDIHWQLAYAYQVPMKLPKGTRIDVQAFYDNSADNPNNPNSPPIVVKCGGRSVDEMSNFSFTYTVDEEHLLQGHPVDNDGMESLNPRSPG